METNPNMYTEEQTETLLSEKINEIIQILGGYTHIENIYCFGTRIFIYSRETIFAEDGKLSETEINFDLLIVTSDDIDNHQDIEKMIQNTFGSSVIATLLFHTKAAVLNGLNENNRFFHTIMEKTRPAFQREAGISLTANKGFDLAKDYTATRLLWDERLSRAESFVEATEHISYEDVDVCTSLLAQGFEQVMLGLIYVFMGYRPEKYNFEFLLSLCSSFDLQFRHVLPRNNDEDIRYFETMSNAYQNVQAEASAYLESVVDIDHLKNKCKFMIKLARQACEIKIGDLKPQN